MCGERRYIAADRQLARQHAGELEISSAWARSALLWWLRGRCLSPLAAVPPLGGYFARASGC